MAKIHLTLTENLAKKLLMEESQDSPFFSHVISMFDSFKLLLKYVQHLSPVAQLTQPIADFLSKFDKEYSSEMVNKENFLGIMILIREKIVDLLTQMNVSLNASLKGSQEKAREVISTPTQSQPIQPLPSVSNVVATQFSRPRREVKPPLRSDYFNYDPDSSDSDSGPTNKKKKK